MTSDSLPQEAGSSSTLQMTISPDDVQRAIVRIYARDGWQSSDLDLLLALKLQLRRLEYECEESQA